MTQSSPAILRARAPILKATICLSLGNGRRLHARFGCARDGLTICSIAGATASASAAPAAASAVVAVVLCAVPIVTVGGDRSTWHGLNSGARLFRRRRFLFLGWRRNRALEFLDRGPWRSTAPALSFRAR